MIISSFKGIHNTNPDRSIDDSSLVDAIDVDIDDSGVLTGRDGYVLSKSQSIDNAYSTRDGQAFIVSNGSLYQVDENLGINLLGSTAATEFCDFGDILFTNDGLKVESGQIIDLKALSPVHSGDGQSITVGSVVYTKPVGDYESTVFFGDDGSLIEPEYIGADGFPDNVEHIEFYDSSLWCSQSLDNQSVIFYSKPFFYNVFDYEVNHIVIPGKVLAISRSNEGLIIGTKTAIYLYNDSLNQLADYGVVPGRPIVKLPDGSVLIHSVRGVCTVPFNNLTETSVDLFMGDKCSTTIIYDHSKFRYVGLSFNETEILTNILGETLTDQTGEALTV